MNQIWVDVGAHQGESSFEFARRDPELTVYAFEPNVRAAAKVFGLLDNYVVIPMAVSEQDGFSRFYLNSYTGASSLNEFNPQGLADWIDGGLLEIERVIAVPTIRLDTFFRHLDVRHVDVLKIDAQGGDYSVVRSAGSRLEDIDKIILEVVVTPNQLYKGAAEKTEVVRFLETEGFVLADVDSQFHGQEENLTFVRRPR